LTTKTEPLLPPPAGIDPRIAFKDDAIQQLIARYAAPVFEISVEFVEMHFIGVSCQTISGQVSLTTGGKSHWTHLTRCQKSRNACAPGQSFAQALGY
jgi:hypothetical protein